MGREPFFGGGGEARARASARGAALRPRATLEAAIRALLRRRSRTHARRSARARRLRRAKRYGAPAAAKRADALELSPLPPRPAPMARRRDDATTRHPPVRTGCRRTGVGLVDRRVRSPRASREAREAEPETDSRNEGAWNRNERAWNRNEGGCGRNRNERARNRNEGGRNRRDAEPAKGGTRTYRNGGVVREQERKRERA